MSSVVLKSASHLYRIFKVYLTLGIIGALAVVTVELVIAKPLALIIGFIAFSFLLMGVLLLAEARKLKTSQSFQILQRRLPKKQPPKLPESLMAVLLPANLMEPILGDFHQEFAELNSKYGRRSAVAWYYTIAMRTVLHVTALYFTLRASKMLIGEFRAFLRRD